MNERTPADMELRVRKSQLIQPLLGAVAHEISNCSQSSLLLGQFLQEFWEDIRGILSGYVREHGDFVAAGIPFSRLETEVPAYLSDIVTNTEKTNTLITELREFVRGVDDPEGETVDLNALVRSALLLVAHPMRKSALDVHMDLAPNLPRARGHPRRLQLALLVFLLDAARMPSETEREVTVATSFDSDNGFVVCEICYPSSRQLGAVEDLRRIARHGGGTLDASSSGTTTRVVLEIPAMGER